MLTVRRVLDQFCKDHHLELGDKIALKAAKRLIDLVADGENRIAVLRDHIELWFHDLEPKGI